MLIPRAFVVVSTSELAHRTALFLNEGKGKITWQHNFELIRPSLMSSLRTPAHIYGSISNIPLCSP